MARIKIKRVVEYYDPQKDVYGRTFKVTKEVYYVLVLKSLFKEDEYLLLNAMVDQLQYKVQLCLNSSDATKFNKKEDAEKILEKIKKHPKWYTR